MDSAGTTSPQVSSTPATPSVLVPMGNPKPSPSPARMSAKRHTPPWKFYGCSHLNREYKMLEKLGEGTFGEVHKAKHLKTNSLVALKRIFLHHEKEGFPLTALREIKILKSLDHPNILALVDMAIHRDPTNRRARSEVYMVSPYMDHDLAGLLANPKVNLKLPHIKCLMQQLLQGMAHLHSRQILHRDIKTANILLSNSGQLAIADFGLARPYFEAPPKPSQHGAGPGNTSYTVMVVTRWYRAPELILGEEKYTSAIDMWGIGCVFGEMFRRVPILQGNSDSDQGHKIFQLLGSPTQENMPGFDKLPGGLAAAAFGPYKRTFEGQYNDLDRETLKLLDGLLKLDPLKRLTALEALDTEFFYRDPKPCSPADLPKYEASHELNARQMQKQQQHNGAKSGSFSNNGNYNGGYRGNGNGNNNGEYFHRPHHNNNNHNNRGSYRQGGGGRYQNTGGQRSQQLQRSQPYGVPNLPARPDRTAPPYRQSNGQQPNYRNHDEPPYRNNSSGAGAGSGPGEDGMPPYRKNFDKQNPHRNSDHQPPYRNNDQPQQQNPSYRNNDHQPPYRNNNEQPPYRNQDPRPPYRRNRGEAPKLEDMY